MKTPERYRQSWVDFCRAKLEINGPDVHMRVAEQFARGFSDAPEGFSDKLWWLTVYTSLCSTPPAYAIWQHWTLDYADRPNEGGLEFWLRENWAGIPVRKNRRPVRAPHKLARCLNDGARWVRTWGPRLKNISYAEAWNSLASEVFSFGRYGIIKQLEVIRRTLGPDYAHLAATDIHPAGAWSPRRALAFLYPAHAELLRKKSDSKDVIAQVNSIAQAERWQLSLSLDRDVSFYEMEALLCNWRTALDSTFYVGRTLDSELEYQAKVLAHFPDNAFPFAKLRKEVFPAECLGEVQGWTGVRKDLFTALSEHDVVWSDVYFDYNKTTDVAHPVRRK